MRRYLVDTNVFVYARGAVHGYREPCRAILRAAADGRIRLEASVELVQEFAHLPLRRQPDRMDALEQVEEVRSQCRLHPFDEDVLTASLDLLGRHPALGVRNAVHAATALRVGLNAIISADRAFDEVAGLSRVDPIDPGEAW